MFIKNFQSSKIFFQSNNQKEFFITCILDGNSTIIQILYGGHLETIYQCYYNISRLRISVKNENQKLVKNECVLDDLQNSFELLIL